MQVRIGINCSGRGDAGGDIVFNIFYGYGHIDLRLPVCTAPVPGISRRNRNKKEKISMGAIVHRASSVINRVLMLIKCFFILRSSFEMFKLIIMNSLNHCKTMSK